MWIVVVAGLAWADTVERTELIAADLDRGLIAYREYYRGDEEEGEGGYDCAYAGMNEADAEMGIRLGIWGAKGVSPTWVIYAPAADEAGCTAISESKASLKAAKTAFKDLRLDLKKPPPTVQLVDNAFDTEAGILAFRSAEEDPHAIAFNRRQIGDVQLETYAAETTWKGEVFIRSYTVRNLDEVDGWHTSESRDLAFSQGDQVAVLGTTGQFHMRGGSDSRVQIWTYDFGVKIKLKEPGKPDLPKLGPKVLDRIQVLGLNAETQTVAFREIAHHLPFDGSEQGASIDCQYQGQKEFPLSSVILKTYKIGDEGNTTDFTVYAAAADSDDCTTRPEATLGLNKAKEKFAKEKIDVHFPPDAIAREDRMFVIDIPGGGTLDVDMDDVEGSDAAFVVDGRVVFVSGDHIVDALLELK